MEIKDNRKEEIMLCTSCLAENKSDTQFCVKCGCPLGAFVNLNPLKRIYSLGWVYRRSVSGPIPKIVLLGMWFIFGTSFLFMAVHLIACLLQAQNEFLKEAPNMLIFTPALIVYCILLFKVTKNYFKFRKKNLATLSSGSSVPPNSIGSAADFEH